MKIGFLELVVVLVVALLLIGPDKLPDYARKAGAALRKFKGYSGKLADEINENIVEPMQDAAEPLKKVAKDITDPLSEMKKTIEDIGKPHAPSKADTPQPEHGSDTPPADGGGGPEQVPAPEPDTHQDGADKSLIEGADRNVE